MKHPKDQLSLSLSSLNVTDKELDPSLISLSQNSLMLALSANDPKYTKDQIDLTESNSQSIEQSEISLPSGKNLERSSFYPLQLKHSLQSKSIEADSFSQSMLTQYPEIHHKQIEIQNSRIEENKNLLFPQMKLSLCKQSENHYCQTQSKKNQQQSSEPFKQTNIQSGVVNSMRHTKFQGKQIQVQPIAQNPFQNLLPKKIYSYNDILQSQEMIEKAYFFSSIQYIQNQPEDQFKKSMYQRQKKNRQIIIEHINRLHYKSQIQFLQNFLDNDNLQIAKRLIPTKKYDGLDYQIYQEQSDKILLDLSWRIFDMGVMLDLKWTNLIKLKLDHCGIDQRNWELLSKSVKKFQSLFSLNLDYNLIQTITQNDLSQFYSLDRFQVLSLEENPFDEQTQKILSQRNKKYLNKKSFQLQFSKKVIRSGKKTVEDVDSDDPEGLGYISVRTVKKDSK